MTALRHGEKWTREEVLAAFVLYLHLPRNHFVKNNRDIKALSQALGRTPSSVARKLSNIEYFDPNRPKGVKGSSHGSHWEPDIWEEMSKRGDGLIEEALQEYRKVMSSVIMLEYNGSPTLEDILQGKDLETKAVSRLNQEHFRNILMDLYEYKCCVTGLEVKQLLIASHIKPWKDADPLTERVNAENGLLLNALHDRAFDKGLITLNKNYEIVVSRELEKMVNSDASEVLRWLWSTRGRQIRMPKAHKPSLSFITYHQDIIFMG